MILLFTFSLGFVINGIQTGFTYLFYLECTIFFVICSLNFFKILNLQIRNYFEKKIFSIDFKTFFKDFLISFLRVFLTFFLSTQLKFSLLVGLAILAYLIVNFVTAYYPNSDNKTKYAI